MNPLIEKFLSRIDRLESRYRGDKYATSWLVPKDELFAVREEIRAKSENNLRIARKGLQNAKG